MNSLNQSDRSDYVKNYLLNINRFGFEIHKIGDPPKEGPYFLLVAMSDDIILNAEETEFNSSQVLPEDTLILYGHKLYGDFIKVGSIQSDNPSAFLMCYKYTI